MKPAGQDRPGERHGLLIPGEVLAVAAEPGDEVAPGEPEGERPGPVAAAELGNVAGLARVPLGQEPRRVTEPGRFAVHGSPAHPGNGRYRNRFPQVPVRA